MTDTTEKHDPDPTYLVNRQSNSGVKIHRVTCRSIQHHYDEFHEEYTGSGGMLVRDRRHPAEFATKSEIEQFHWYTGCGQCKPDITPFVRRRHGYGMQDTRAVSVAEKHIGRDFLKYGRLQGVEVHVMLTFDNGETITFGPDDVLEYRLPGKEAA